jgi:poly(A) polymerase
MASAKKGASLPSLAAADWLNRPQTRAVFAALGATGAEARAVGGAVRNALMGIAVKDVDIATTAQPEEVMRLARKAGLQAIPTGIEHGTVTVIAEHVPFEVTTLRKDVETFGRHARVTFTTDWREDAARRDFTINALYCGADGTVHDPLGGIGDIEERRVRFIGDARERIREDYLRVLRFFRFHATYAAGQPFDADGLAAGVAEKAGLSQLSAERVRAELLLLLAAPGAVESLRAMHDAGLLAPLLGTQGNVALVARVADIENAAGLETDPILRLAALATDASGRPVPLKERLRLSSAEADRIAHATRTPPDRDEREAKVHIYRHGTEAFRDALIMDWARSGADTRDPVRMALLRLSRQWQAPVLPARGADILALGVPAGPGVGRVMTAFENWWIGAGFPPDAKTASSKLQELAAEELSTGGSP